MASPQGPVTPPPTATLIEEIAGQPDEPRTLQRVVELALAEIPGSRWVGITRQASKAQPLRDRVRSLATVAASDVRAEQADQAQYELQEGPCVDAAFANGFFLVDDTRSEPRWPRWAARAHALGVRSSLSVHLGTSTETIGGLNLYADHEHAFDDDALQVAQNVAAHAAAALVVAHRLSGLQSALQTRHTIGAAQGVLMIRHGLTLEQAFTVLVRLSRDNNVKLRDLAAEVVEHRGVPPRFLDDHPGAHGRGDS